jgi:hypothetical protein
VLAVLDGRDLGFGDADARLGARRSGPKAYMGAGPDQDDEKQKGPGKRQGELGPFQRTTPRRLDSRLGRRTAPAQLVMRPYQILMR